MSENPDQSILKVAVRAANEGIPIASIGRILLEPFDTIHSWLSYALSIGEVGHMPRPDWPPTAKWSDRLPGAPRAMDPDDTELQCTRIFKLTPLESGFLKALLQHNFVSKETLHGIAKHLRYQRLSLPNATDEDTDPKIVDVIICKLRRKLRETEPAFVIETVRSKGYFFEPSVKQKIFDMVASYDSPISGNRPAH